MELRKIEKEPGRLRLYQKTEVRFRHTSKKIHELDSSVPVCNWTMQIQTKNLPPYLGRHKCKPDTVVCVLYNIILEHNLLCYSSIIVIGWGMTGVTVCRTKGTPASQVQGHKHSFLFKFNWMAVIGFFFTEEALEFLLHVCTVHQQYQKHFLLFQLMHTIIKS